MTFTRKTWLAIAAGALLASPLAIASDHTDGSQATNDPAADITDLYTWMTDATHLTLIMDVTKAASPATLFSNSVKYTFHTYTHGGPGGTGTPTIPVLSGSVDPEIDVICTFDTSTPQNVSCWVSNTNGPAVLDYATGASSMTTPVASADGKLKIYAGLRADPFFFNLTGFKATAATVDAAKGTLTYDAAGCPAVSGATLTLLDTELTTGADGGAAADDFAGLDVNAIVVQVDLSLLTANSPVVNGAAADSLVSVWASTNN